MSRWTLFVLLVFAALAAPLSCNDESRVNTGGQGGECQADAECDDGYCLEGECVECHDDGHCSGDQICSQSECVSGCQELDCGEGGSCVDQEGSISCECDDGYVLSGQVCEPCDCDVENGTGECGTDGVCEIASCDDGYSTEDDDPETGCECGPDDAPDGDFTDENCDGVDGDMSTAIFVSKFGEDSNDGVPGRPVATIERGIELATAEDGPGDVYIAEGEYEETLRIEEAVNLYGGYEDLGGGEWDRGSEFETVIVGEAQTYEHRPVGVTGIEDDMEIQHMTIEAADAPVDIVDNREVAGTSAALALYDNDGHLDVSHTTLVAGRGRDGADGTAADGRDGANGQHAGQAGDTAGRSGGTTTCDYSNNTSGGDGGRGGTASSANGERGQPGSGSGGGGGGAGGSTMCAPSPDPVLAGGPGEDASGGSSNGAGAGPVDETTALTSPPSVDSLLLYEGRTGERGESGTAGSSGGGGGGAGYFRLQDPVAGCLNPIDSSPGGAGGGAGGCGGQGGGGGRAAGGSVAVLSLSSSVTVTDSELRTDTGGDAGSGHAGADGGAGGQGGNPYSFNSFSGGAGGSGSGGGRGGPGSGGEGGPSVGILHQDSQVDTTGLTFDLGRAGDGGHSPGSAENGPDGLEAEVHGYDD